MDDLKNVVKMSYFGLGRGKGGKGAYHPQARNQHRPYALPDIIAQREGLYALPDSIAQREGPPTF